MQIFFSDNDGRADKIIFLKNEYNQVFSPTLYSLVVAALIDKLTRSNTLRLII